MFDTFVTRQRTQDVYVNQRTTVTEKRAPTDESVRLLREMEEKAREQVLASLRLDNSPVDVIMQVTTDRSGWEHYVECAVRINGETIKSRTSVDPISGVSDMLTHVVDDLANAIARQLLRRAFETDPRVEQALLPLLRGAQ